jgi:hypothetical protein
MDKHYKSNLTLETRRVFRLYFKKVFQSFNAEI